MLTKVPSWVAVVTYSQAERLAASTLAGLGIEVYLPMMHSRDLRRKKVMDERPMFPGYIFAKISAKEVYATRTARGVMCLVTSAHSVCVVPQREIDAVRAFEATQRKVFIHQTSQLVKGAAVTITEGEFAGLQGRLVRGCPDGNFAVGIEVMNVSFVVHLRRDELRPATPPEDEGVKGS